MREVILPASRYLCHIYEIKDDDEFRKALQEMTAVKEYGENVKLPDGTVLHNNYDDENYIAPYGERKLLRFH